VNLTKIVRAGNGMGGCLSARTASPHGNGPNESQGCSCLPLTLLSVLKKLPLFIL
jgi:hypothetical protein